MNGMLKLVSELSRGRRAQRALEQMTLGDLISVLESLPSDRAIVGISQPMSYRGYYSDLSFVVAPTTQTVGDLLRMLNEKCLGQTFEGYKGGDFLMDKYTPLWISGYGVASGTKIMGLNTETDPINLNTAQEEWQ